MLRRDQQHSFFRPHLIIINKKQVFLSSLCNLVLVRGATKSPLVSGQDEKVNFILSRNPDREPSGILGPISVGRCQY